ncbi:twin-arginine translocation signal domain-containing protein [Catenuloplanes atrovinosus]|uniref:Uncharacterized protein n=1 Tax=Catenuloplanes atrovinosus TaxID=137266 RepID=A0AAE3YJ71_9ACTN|nr:twin-arginine translocation signal domain-containing protein [Catenuloplanes atrovinosus]MDR7273385.1 hypothetical protein [Catenuloplanes atrovinosus]
MGSTRDLTRRRVLAGSATLAGAAVASGACSLFGDGDPPVPPPPPPPDALEPLLAETRALAALYQAALTAHPNLADRLTPPLEAHTAHAAALTEIMSPTPSAPASTVASAAPTAATTSPAQETLAALRAAEQTGRETAATACATAPPERAALLGSIAAARATHAEVLS